jgi:5-(carboxyamino)imidazole ribonucleotide synthase
VNGGVNGRLHVGILGGGQLGRMLALAGYPLGMRFRVLEPATDAPAGHLAEHLAGGYDDPAMLDRFAAGLDVVTYEFENVPVAAAEHLAQRVPVYPPPAALATAQDRLEEKHFFTKLEIPTPRFAAVDARADLEAAIAVIGLPGVIKTRRLGYDGKGQAVVRNPEDADSVWQMLSGQPLIYEAFVPFDRELSILAVRGHDGATAFYPLVENQHRDGILRLSLGPAPACPSALQQQAESYARRALAALDYVGVLGIELFQVGDVLLANEMAPRVHNSGHWTIEGAVTSQFEQHLRAVCGLPLGDPAPRGLAAMVNLIGTTPDPADVLAIPGAHLHDYGKAPRSGRKLGHITLVEADRATLQAKLNQIGVR